MITLPMASTATHRVLLGQDTPVRELVPSTLVTVQAAFPPVGLLGRDHVARVVYRNAETDAGARHPVHKVGAVHVGHRPGRRPAGRVARGDQRAAAGWIKPTGESKPAAPLLNTEARSGTRHAIHIIDAAKLDLLPGCLPPRGVLEVTIAPVQSTATQKLMVGQDTYKG